MGIKVNTGIAQAGVSLTRPRLGVVVVAPAVGVSYVAPASSISYVDLAVSAELDNTGLYRYITESAAVIDGLRHQFAKSLGDAVSTTDKAILNAGKGLRDTISFQEVVTRTLIFIRSFEESIALQSRPQLHLSRPVSDSFGLSDAARLEVIKAAQDTILTADFLTRSMDKGLADATDELVEFLAFSVSKVLADQAIAQDAIQVAVAKALADSLSLSDYAVRSVSKSLFDGVGMNDSAETADGLLTQVMKSVANVVFATDVLTRSSSKQATDSAVAQDTRAISFSRPVSDSFGQTDSVFLTPGKGLAESQSIADAARLSVTRLAADSFGVTEFVSRLTGKAATDSQGLSDAGSLISQGYCDLTYFAGDYVGQARTF